MCYLMAWNLKKRSWERQRSKKPMAEALAHVIVCTNNQNSFGQSQDTSYFAGEKNLPVYRLGIECECSCKDCLKILQSFQDTKN
jgi:hypothetical protein